ncbi:MAG TPA: hypothetical protein VG271_01700, partial [Beijerinckiaceae bacterium]|nr:hypothetical protein [Beijerinckiaceae bacterium]
TLPKSLKPEDVTLADAIGLIDAKAALGKKPRLGKSLAKKKATSGAGKTPATGKTAGAPPLNVNKPAATLSGAKSVQAKPAARTTKSPTKKTQSSNRQSTAAKPAAEVTSKTKPRKAVGKKA